MSDFHVGAWAMVNYIYNTSGAQFAKDAFPGEHPNYLAEKAESWAASPSRAMGFLDEAHMRDLLEIVQQRYEERARRTMAGI